MQSLNLDFLRGASAAGTGPVFRNDRFTLAIAQIEGTFTALSLSLEGRTNAGGPWVVIAGWNVATPDTKAETVSANGIYEFPIEGIVEIRFRILSISGGSVNAVGVLYDSADSTVFPYVPESGPITFGNPNLFVKGQAEQIFFDPATGNIVGYDRTATEGSVSITANLAEITGGMGNQLIGVLPDTARISGTYTSAAFSLTTRERIMGGEIAYNAVAQICETLSPENGVLRVSHKPEPGYEDNTAPVIRYGPNVFTYEGIEINEIFDENGQIIHDTGILTDYIDVFGASSVVYQMRRSGDPPYPAYIVRFMCYSESLEPLGLAAIEVHEEGRVLTGEFPISNAAYVRASVNAIVTPYDFSIQCVYEERRGECHCYIREKGKATAQGTAWVVNPSTREVEGFIPEDGKQYEVTYFTHRVSAQTLAIPTIWNPVVMTVQTRYGVYAKQNGSAERGILKGWLYLIAPRCILNSDAGANASQSANANTGGNWIALPGKPENMPMCDCGNNAHPLAYYVYVPCAGENDAVSSVVSIGSGLTLKAGRSAQLPIKLVMPDDTLIQPNFSTLGYMSANDSIATVDNDGVVTGVSAGETIVRTYVYKSDGSSLSCATIIVVEGARTVLTANPNNIIYG